MSNKQNEIKIVNEQILATVLFIGTLVISLILSYDKKEKLKGNNGIFTKKQVKAVSIANRVAVLAIVIFFFYIDEENINVARIQNKDLKLLYLQEIVEIITTITAILALYITVKSGSNEFVGIENPNT